MQFEGSLGKLTVSSVNNPRKMIDAVVTSRSEDDVSVSTAVCSRNSGLSLVPRGHRGRESGATELFVM